MSCQNATKHELGDATDLEHCFESFTIVLQGAAIRIS